MHRAYNSKRRATPAKQTVQSVNHWVNASKPDPLIIECCCLTLSAHLKNAWMYFSLFVLFSSCVCTCLWTSVDVAECMCVCVCSNVSSSSSRLCCGPASFTIANVMQFMRMLTSVVFLIKLLIAGDLNFLKWLQAVVLAQCALQRLLNFSCSFPFVCSVRFVLHIVATIRFSLWSRQSSSRFGKSFSLSLSFLLFSSVSVVSRACIVHHFVICLASQKELFLWNWTNDHFCVDDTLPSEMWRESLRFVSYCSVCDGNVIKFLMNEQRKKTFPWTIKSIFPAFFQHFSCNWSVNGEF